MTIIKKDPLRNEEPWDVRFFELAKHIASWSKDRSTKVGAVIVNEKDRVVKSMGYNGFPRGIDDDNDEYHKRPAKYKWAEHAERNAIYNAARNGIAIEGCTMYVTFFPCTDCARSIIQSGIQRVVAPQPNLKNEKWGEDFKLSLEMFMQSGISVRRLPI